MSMLFRKSLKFTLVVLCAGCFSACATTDPDKSKYKPQFFPAESVKYIEFIGKYRLTTEDLKLEIGEKDNRITITVPAGFVTDTTSMIGLRDNKILNNSSVLHDYIYWVQPCSEDKGRKIANKIMHHTNKASISIKFLAWLPKKAVQLFDFLMGKEDPWAKNARLKKLGETRFATGFIDKRYWEEIRSMKWEDFMKVKHIKQSEQDRTISNEKICCLFKQWCGE